MKGNFLKCFLVLFAACFLFLGAGVAQAATSPDVMFYLINDLYDDDLNEVTLNISSTGVLPVQYSFIGGSDAGDWTSFDEITSKQLTVTFDDGDIQKPIYLRINYATPIYTGNITYEDPVEGKDDLYYGLTIDWDTTSRMSFAFAENNGMFSAAPVPIPATVWLLGAGVMAIVGIRRKNAA